MSPRPTPPPTSNEASSPMASQGLSTRPRKSAPAMSLGDCDDQTAERQTSDEREAHIEGRTRDPSAVPGSTYARGAQGRTRGRAHGRGCRVDQRTPCRGGPPAATREMRSDSRSTLRAGDRLYQLGSCLDLPLSRRAHVDRLRAEQVDHREAHPVRHPNQGHHADVDLPRFDLLKVGDVDVHLCGRAFERERAKVAKSPDAKPEPLALDDVAPRSLDRARGAFVVAVPHMYPVRRSKAGWYGTCTMLRSLNLGGSVLVCVGRVCRRGGRSPVASALVRLRPRSCGSLGASLFRRSSRSSGEKLRRSKEHPHIDFEGVGDCGKHDHRELACMGALNVLHVAGLDACQLPERLLRQTCAHSKAADVRADRAKNLLSAGETHRPERTSSAST